LANIDQDLFILQVWKVRMPRTEALLGKSQHYLVVGFTLVSPFSLSYVKAETLKYNCYSQHVLNPRMLDSLRDKMAVEIDTSRPSISLTQVNYGLFTTKSTYSPGGFRKGDGFTFTTRFRADPSIIYLEYGVASIKFDFKKTELTFSLSMEFPMKFQSIQ
jgi:hypothetical protein